MIKVLYDENGNPMGLDDIAEHFVETYPDDIFAEGQNKYQKIVIQIRELFKELLLKRSKTE